MRVRFRARAGHRIELAEARGPDIRIGSSPECQIILHHSSVADVHAHVLLRRGRLIMRSSGRRGTRLSLDGMPIAAPILLRSAASVTLGDVEIRAWPSRRPGLPAHTFATSVLREIESRCHIARRYRIDRRTEALFVPHTDRVRAWCQRTDATKDGRSAHLARRQGVWELDDHLAVVEHVSEGIRLSALVEAAGQGLFKMSVAAALVIAGHAALGLAAYHRVAGPHGSPDPEHIHLALDGSAVLLPSGPDPLVNLTYAAPERRLGLGASKAADAYGWARLTLELLTFAGDPEPAHPALKPLLVREPRQRSTDIAEASAHLSAAYFATGHDAGPQDAGRLIRLLAHRPDHLIEAGPRPSIERSIHTVDPG